MSLNEGVRTHKLDLEAKLKTTVRIGHPSIAWMVENVADIINKFKIGQDGRTGYERLKGKTYSGVIHEFGSVILHRIPVKPQRGLMLERVVRTRNVRPKSLEDTWNMEEIDKIKGQPWDPSVTLTYEKVGPGQISQDQRSDASRGRVR